MSAFAAQFHAALAKAMSRSEAASLAGKASAAARRAKAGGSAPGGSAFDQASAKANALIAANPGKYGPKGAKGKGKGKAKAGAKPKAAKDPAAAKAKAEKDAQAKTEHEQRAKEHAQDRAQRQSDREQKQKEHTQSQAEHAQDRTARQQAQAAKQKQQAQKQKQQAKAKAKPAGASKPAAAPKAAASVAPPEVAAAASALSSGGQITPAQSQQLVTNGLARPQKDGSLVLTSTGLKAAQQQTQKLAKAFTPVSAWHGWAAITKVDEAQRIVYGDASTETPDAQPGIWKGEQYAGDIIAMDAIAAALPDYMQWANLREMHQPSAAGVVIDASVEGSRFPIAAHVTDDQAWKKVTTGTYKGFSIGGQCQDAEIIKIEGRPFRRITKLSLTEISLVDRPANPQARITLYKGADMAEHDIATEDVATNIIAKAADPTKAIALLQQLRNDAETSGDMDAADEYTAAIRSVAQAAGIATTAADDTDTEPDADDAGLAMDDGSDPSTDVAMAVRAGDLRKAFPNHSDDDLIDLLLKRGAAISGTTMGHLKGAHDSLQKATGGAVCAQPGQPQSPTIAQAAMLAPDDLAKAVAPAFEGIAKLLEQNGLVVKDLVKRLDHLEQQPAPGAPAARVVAVEKVLPGVPETAAADPTAVELELLKKQREKATDPKILEYLGNEITKVMISRGYRS